MEGLDAIGLLKVANFLHCLEPVILIYYYRVNIMTNKSQTD